jgi:hypothetical protein
MAHPNGGPIRPGHRPCSTTVIGVLTPSDSDISAKQPGSSAPFLTESARDAEIYQT